MIELHRLNGEVFTLNPQHIEVMESTPDTVITLTNDRKYIVKDRIPEIIEKIKGYNREIFGNLGRNG
ncbi:MAG TPA: flagellar FlbD family protein [Spirochaetota bacterium]|nr:flagellar FlbD family protein [Spirochaetota bacterium]